MSCRALSTLTLPPAGHRPQCTRPAASSFTSTSQPPPPPPAASRTAPRSPPAPPPDAPPPLATFSRPSKGYWPGSLAVTLAPPPRRPTLSAAEPPVAPPCPLAAAIGPLLLSFSPLLVYMLVRHCSPAPIFSYTVLRSWRISPPLHCDHWPLPPDFPESLVALERPSEPFLQTASEPPQPGSPACNTLASRPLTIAIGYYS